MNILILCQTFPLTTNDSTAPFMYDFARGFTGHSVTVLVPFHPRLKPNSFKGIRVIPYRYIWPDSLHLVGFARTLKNDQQLTWHILLLTPFYLVSTVCHLFKVMKRNSIDVVNAHWLLPNGFLASLVCFITRTPLVITLPGSDVYIAKKNILFSLAAKFATRVAKRVVSNSPQLLQDLGVKGEIIHYGVPVTKSKRVSNKKLSIATAGRFVEKKGFALLKNIVPDIEIISGLTLADFRKKLLSVDIFVALSIRDRQGNLDDSSLVVLEAMAAGCAVVVSDLPGYRKVITSGVNGILVNARVQLKVKNAVDSLKKSPELRKKLGLSARITMQKSFTPEIIARKYAHVFSSLVHA